MKKKLNILLVDDNPTDVDLLNLSLCEKYKITIHRVETEIDYLTELNSFNPDIIISDHDSSKINFSKTLLIKNKKAPLIPLILMTDSVNEADAIKYMEKGTDDYFIKGNLLRLLAAVKSSIDKKTILQDIAERKHVEEELYFRNILLSTQLETSIDGILVVDDNNIIISYNHRFVEMMGIPQELIDTKSDVLVLKYVTERMADPQTFYQKVQYLNKNKRETTRDEIVLKDGRIFDRYSSPMFSENVDYGRIWYFRDITDSKNADRAVHESEEKFRIITENSADAIFIVNGTGKYLYVNNTATELLGYSREELYNMSIEDLSPVDKIEDYYKLFQKLIRDGRVLVDFELKKKDGTLLPTELNGTILPNGTIYASCRDITKRKMAENELLKERKQLKNIIDASPIAIWFKDTKNNFLRVNETAAKITKMSIQDMEGHSADEIFPLETVEYYQDDLEVINSGKSKLAIIESATSNGKISWLRTDKIPWYDGNGNIAGIIAFSEDITERFASEKKLIASELRYRRLFESAKDGILILDFESGEIVDVNPFLVKMLGYSYKELLGKELWEIGVFKNIAVSKEAFYELQKMEYIRFENMPFETKNGKRISVEFVSNVYEVDNKKVIQCNIRDITERKLAEEEIKMLAHSISSINECVSITDNKDKIIFVNDAFLKTYGYSREELIGSHIHMLQPNDVKVNIGYKILSLSRNGSWKGEVINQRKNGSLFPIFLSTSVIKDEKGNPIALIGVATDITEDKLVREELIRAKEKAEEMSRLKTSFLNNMSHELRTPLIGILGFTDILESEIEDPVHKKMITQIHSGGKRLSETLNLILDLSKTESEYLTIEIKLINISQITREQVANFEGAAKVKGLTLKIIIDDENILINTNERLYCQILDNLINNAIKFTDSGGVGIILGKEIKVIDGKSENFVSLKVIDSGIGIAEEHYKLIFEEYRQVSEGLSRTFQGSGLGLSVTKKFVQKLGGDISVVSKIGAGSTFTVLLPAANTSLEKEIAAEEAKIEITPDLKQAPSGELPKVLLIDDDILTYNVSELFLKNICELQHVSNGKDSIELVKKNQFKIILLDINLGYGMNGLTALQEIRKVAGYEEIPVVALTAYAMSDDKEYFLNSGCDYYLSKPFEKAALKNMIIEILHKKTA